MREEEEEDVGEKRKRGTRSIRTKRRRRKEEEEMEEGGRGGGDWFIVMRLFSSQQPSCLAALVELGVDDVLDLVGVGLCGERGLDVLVQPLVRRLQALLYVHRRVGPS
jgi:hypothetical protein